MSCAWYSLYFNCIVGGILVNIILHIGTDTDIDVDILLRAKGKKL